MNSDSFLCFAETDVEPDGKVGPQHHLDESTMSAIHTSRQEAGLPGSTHPILPASPRPFERVRIVKMMDIVFSIND